LKEVLGWGVLECGLHSSKALLHNAEVAHIVTKEAKTYGIQFEGAVKMDYSQAFKRSRQVSTRLVKGVQFLMKKNKIDTFEGWATLQDDHHVEVALNAGGTEQITFKNLILATGSNG
jgi:dihydrolipoamide dehydrogenase